MSSRPSPRVGIVDSGHALRQQAWVQDSAAFAHEPDGLWRRAASADVLGHGSAVVDIVHHLAPDARLWVAQVFGERPMTTAAQVAAAVDWLVGEGVQLINLSLGMRDDRAVLAQACGRALAAGVVLCASSPSHGAPVFPAALPGVWRITGDARCARDEFSWLGTTQADFGAHVTPLRPGHDGPIVPGQRPPAGSGASMACAHFSGHLAAQWASLTADDLPARLAEMRARAHHHGPERRDGPVRTGAAT